MDTVPLKVPWELRVQRNSSVSGNLFCWIEIYFMFIKYGDYFLDVWETGTLGRPLKMGARHIPMELSISASGRSSITSVATRRCWVWGLHIHKGSHNLKAHSTKWHGRGSPGKKLMCDSSNISLITGYGHEYSVICIKDIVIWGSIGDSPDIGVQF